MARENRNALAAMLIEKQVKKIMEEEPSSKSWEIVDKSKLPKEAFLWIVDPEKKSTWKLPYREGSGGIDPETGMYKKAGAVNLNALRSIAAAAAGARSGKPMSLPAEIKSKIKRLLKTYKIGKFAESKHEKGRTDMTELFEQLSTLDTGAYLDKENNVIRNVAILRPTSENRFFEEAKGREYSENARNQIAGMLEGKKAFFNHATKKSLEERCGVRDIQDMFGYYSEGRLDNDGVVRADLHYLKTYKYLIEPIVEQMADKVGLSHHSFGSLAFDKDREVEVVENIKDLKSIDLVTEPGSTINLFESKQASPTKQTEYKETENMDYSLITLSALKENRSDLLDKIKNDILESINKEDDMNTVKQENEKLITENNSLKNKLDEYEVKEKLQKKTELIQNLLSESKIDKEFITDIFMESLKNAQTEEAMKKLIEDRKSLIKESNKGVSGMGQEANEFKENKQGDEISDDDYVAAIGGR